MYPDSSICIVNQDVTTELGFIKLRYVGLSYSNVVSLRCSPVEKTKKVTERDDKGQGSWIFSPLLYRRESQKGGQKTLTFNQYNLFINDLRWSLFSLLKSSIKDYLRSLIRL